MMAWVRSRAVQDTASDIGCRPDNTILELSHGPPRGCPRKVARRSRRGPRSGDASPWTLSPAWSSN